MMKKALFILVLSLLFGSSSIAQVNFGVTVGLNASNFVESGNDEDVFNKNRYGFLGGLVMDLGITKNFSIIPELLYSQKGAGISVEEDSGDYLKSVLSLDYIQIPVNLALKFNIGRSSKIFIFAGPYAGYAISGKWNHELKMNGVTNKETSDIKFGTKEDDDINPLDVGIDYGLGFQFGKIFFKLQGVTGLTDLSNSDGDNDYKINNVSFSISAGYYF